ncbi:MAG TPA: APC family permease [Nocardioidaceae bacterium]|nr:APC family permease [Nocardioidaceae bacterium]
MTTSSSTPNRVDVEMDRGLRRDIGKIGLLFTGVGSIIGSGWLFGALYASQLAGPASILAWALGAVMIALVGITYAELGVMFPVAGGVIRFPHYAFGSFASFTAGWITWISAAATTPIEVLAAIQYATPYLPWLMNEVDGVLVLTTAGIAVAVVLMFVFSFINILGVRAFARFNNVLVWWKLAVIILVIVVLGVAAFNLDHFANAEFGGFAPYGFDKVFAALPAAGIVFAYLGFRQGVEFAGETDNPQRNVPFAVLGAILITAVLYIGLQAAFISAVPDQSLADGWHNLSFASDAGPLAALALLIGITWLAILLYADAIISPADTGLIFAALTARLSYSQARVGNAPQWLAKLNNKGVPWASVLVMFVVGCLFFLPFPSWGKLVGFIVSGTVLSFGTGPVVVGALRRQLPDQERPFRLPGGDTLPYLGFLCANLIVYWTGWTTNWKLFVAVGLGYVILGLYYVFARDRSQIPPLQLNAGWWMLLWLAGLAALSYFGHYEGGTDLLPFGWGELLTAAFSAAVYVIAVATRLSPAMVVDNVRRTHVEEPAGLAD